MLYTLNLHSNVCQLYLKKSGGGGDVFLDRAEILKIRGHYE